MMDLYARIKGRMRRAYMRLFGLRPASYPYISGDGFRKLAEHVFDSTSDFNPLKVRAGEIVFVESSLIEEHFSRIHPLIKEGYVLITHNGDANITEHQTRHIDDRILHWFGQNVLTRHPKLTPLPIGLENAWHARAGDPTLFEAARKTPCDKNGRVLASFSTSSNPGVREPALDALKSSPMVDTVTKWPSPKNYLKLLSRYSYVASPPGNGEDCHRTWEALYLGTVPIVQSSVCVEYFRDIGVPLMITASWESLGRELSERMPAPSETTDAIFFDYWKNLIISKTHQHEAR